MQDLILVGLMVLSLMIPNTAPPEKVVTVDTTEIKALAKTSFKTAENQIFKGDVVVPDDNTDGKCDGSGWITQGDGHRSRCPYDGCHNAGVVNVFEEVVEVPQEPEPVKPSTTDVNHKCKCDTKSTYCVCVKKFGKCSCTKK